MLGRLIMRSGQLIAQGAGTSQSIRLLVAEYPCCGWWWGSCAPYVVRSGQLNAKDEAASVTWVSECADVVKVACGWWLYSLKPGMLGSVTARQAAWASSMDRRDSRSTAHHFAPHT
jgi:hypothetical protein